MNISGPEIGNIPQPYKKLPPCIQTSTGNKGPADFFSTGVYTERYRQFSLVSF